MAGTSGKGDALDMRLDQLRGKLSDLERRVEALSELAARLPDSIDPPSTGMQTEQLFFDSEGLGEDLI